MKLLTKSILDRLIREELDKRTRHHNEKQNRKMIRSLKDIPPAFGNEIESPLLFELNPDETTQQEKHREAVDKARKEFQEHYRSLSPSVRFSYEKWLRSALIKNLSLDEASEIVARFSSATKGQDEPRRINKKPS